MYKINGYFPVVRCICGHNIILCRAAVCKCGVTMRFRRVPGKRGLCQPLAVVPDNYDLAARPFKRPGVVDWKESEVKA